MNLTELARRIGVHPATIKGWQKKGWLPSYWKNFKEYSEDDLQIALAVKNRSFECPTCGRMMKQQIPPSHLNSAYHKHAKRIRALLRKPCITMEEIGKRIGVSGERVRQLMLHMEGVAGRERRQICTLRKYRNKNKALQMLELIAELHGLELELIPTKSDKDNSGRLPGYRHSIIRINGYLCRICSATTTNSVFKPASKEPSTYLAIKRPLADSLNGERLDFCLWYSKDFDVWFVVPYKNWPDTQTLFSLAPKWGGPKKTRHDWLDYKDAWHLLSPRKQGLPDEHQKSVNAEQHDNDGKDDADDFGKRFTYANVANRPVDQKENHCAYDQP